MKGMLNVMRGQAGAAMQRLRHAKLGIVSAYDPNTYTVKVQFPFDDGSEPETGWIPLGALAVGNQWGVYAPPALNDQILVVFQDGALNAGIAVQCIFDDLSPPLPVPSGEIWMVHKSTSALKFHNDGSVELISNSNLTATVGGNLTANISGTATIAAQSWSCSGNVSWNGNWTFTGEVTANGHRIDDSHKHSGGTLTGGLTGTPQ
ncbi:MAG TPA: phage baseplate assembly protein V [Dyella sp.]|uniref:phage baseplate assembly protein V n=1 Tax=Dyella sp. TaxID=1869338 RepID=UPI002CF5540D|nr:phage baseplate assembly protein V [Dyella sp.]HUB91408.1 phage baseplate assembly protein V [Dyella sp.]